MISLDYLSCSSIKHPLLDLILRMELIPPYWAGYLTATNTTELFDNDISFIFSFIGKNEAL